MLSENMQISHKVVFILISYIRTYFLCTENPSNNWQQKYVKDLKDLSSAR